LIDARSPAAMSESRGSGLDSRSMGAIDPRSLDARTSGVGLDGRLVGALDMHGGESSAEREEIVISTLSWPPDTQDQGLTFVVQID
jgi:hypothetical protein